MRFLLRRCDRGIMNDRNVVNDGRNGRKSHREQKIGSIDATVRLALCATIVSIPSFIGAASQHNHDASFWVDTVFSAVSLFCEVIVIFQVFVRVLLSSLSSRHKRMVAVSLYAVMYLAQAGDFHFKMKVHETPDIELIRFAIRQPLTYLQSEFKNEATSAMKTLAIVSLAHALAYVTCGKNWNTITSNESIFLKNRMLVFSLCIAFYLQCFTNAWMPIISTATVILQSLVSTHIQLAITETSRGMESSFAELNLAQQPSVRDAPNIVFVLHESLSGHLLHTKEGKENAPFFHSLRDAEDAYVFRHARAINGNSDIAIPAVSSGYLGYGVYGSRHHESSKYTLATDCKSLGYRTAMFSSGPTDWSGTLYDTNHYFLKSFNDHVTEPKTTADPLVNGHCIDDRALAPHFNDFILKNDSSPFLASFSFNANHHPFQAHEEYSGSNSICLEKYYSSLRVFDESLKGVIDMLSKAGLSNNTIVAGVADHGEDPEKIYKRASIANSRISTVPMYLIVPPGLFASTEQNENLRHNTYQVASSIDLVQTVRAIALGGRNVPSNKLLNVPGCLKGRDLTKSKVPENRVVFNYQYKRAKHVDYFGLLTKTNAVMVQGPRGKGLKKQRLLCFPYWNGKNEDLLSHSSFDSSSFQDCENMRNVSEKKLWLDRFDDLTTWSDDEREFLLASGQKWRSFVELF